MDGRAEAIRDPRAEGRVANLINVLGNLLLSGGMLLVGLTFQSQALIADGLHHAGDVLHTLIAWVGFRIAERPADEDHPYGHGNAESVAGILIGVILLATGALVLYGGIESIVEGQFVAQGWLSLGTAIAAAALKGVLARYSLRVGTQLNSPTLIAVAQDHRSDVATSLGAAVGVAGAMAGYPVLDSVAAIFIGVYIVGFLSFPVLRSNLDVLMDAAPRTDLAERIRSRYAADPEVRSVDLIRIHPLGPYYEIDLEISIDGDLPVREGHTIAHRVRDEIIASEKHVREVKIHVNPYQ